MRSQHRRDQCLAEKLAEHLGVDTGLLCADDGMGQGTIGRSCVSALGAHAADIVLILGDVGEVGEIAEGADDTHGFRSRHAVEDRLQLPSGVLVLIAVEAHRGLTDVFDKIEDGRAFLIAHGIAENAAEQPDILAELGIGGRIGERHGAQRRGFLIDRQGHGHGQLRNVAGRPFGRMSCCDAR